MSRNDRQKKAVSTAILLVTATLCTAVTSGCDQAGAEGESEAAPAEQTDPAMMEPPGTVVQLDSTAGQTPKSIEWFEQASTHDRTIFADSRTHLCVLSGVQGDFSYGLMDLFRLPNTTGYWLQSGNSQNGWALCAKWSNFVGPSG